ncbi:sensor histidine kinase [Nocardioides marmoribigeumensis]|uniref:histidine kinase n=1 Tax=Nocardioides marmoribigeumensis TaxID=433649 RepID=A0ABU2BYV9_9ACTN|nr:histidine kinase N-terminal domain-containing protein [Nocardioides marmoribigeumensis]MDR7363581.1 two-component sensor histidine kinase [Nocardioides marmoribigeumensis]
MATVSEAVRAHTDLDESDLAWLSLLLGDWQVVADLAFADLVLWLPDKDGDGWWAGAQMRPTTGPTAYVDDVVGSHVVTGGRPMLEEAMRTGRVVREGRPDLRDAVPVRVEAIPVRHGDRLLGVVTRTTNLLGVRTPSRLELAYLSTAAELTAMIGAGLFPFPGGGSTSGEGARVGDGFVRLTAAGRVSYASPNALSVFRRLGLTTDLAGLDLAETTRALIPAERRPDEETISAVLGGRRARETELGDGTTVLVVRSIPLLAPVTGGPPEHQGALVLVRDVTDLRSRDRDLITKDATIREIHHRVKNNLQTVAALLRIQARRMTVPEARAALEEATRRVGSIALVHETLSHSLEESVEFDEVATGLAQALADVFSTDGSVEVVQEGSFGTMPAEAATALAMVLTELLQNAAEHAFGGGSGRVVVRAVRSGAHLVVEVCDDGAGLPAGLPPESTSLGLSIVRTLVETELRGTFALGPGDPRGTVARVEADLPS